MNYDKMVLFISSPNSFADVFQIFLKCMRKYWPDCPYEIVLSTNDQSYEGITVYNNHLEQDGWLDRAIPVLKQLTCPYVLLICDDCLISKKVDNAKVESMVQDMMDYHLDFCGIANHVKGKPLHDGSCLDRVKKNRPYALNLLAGIYRREYLLEVLGDGSRTTWEIENQWLKEATEAKGEYFDNVVSCNEDVFGCRNGILKGKWYYSVIEDMNAAGVEIKTDRPVMSPKEEKQLLTRNRIGKMIPAWTRPLIKKVMKKFGRSFAAEN